MRKAIIAAVAATVLAAATVATPKPAEARCIGCWVGGIAAGIVGAALIANAASAYGYGYGGYAYPAYYGYGYSRTDINGDYIPAYGYGYDAPPVYYAPQVYARPVYRGYYGRGYYARGYRAPVRAYARVHYARHH
jgi:hypothetical protein